MLAPVSPEGDDKPYKYPNIYRGLDVLIINKTDLLPYIDFRMIISRQGSKFSTGADDLCSVLQDRRRHRGLGGLAAFKAGSLHQKMTADLSGLRVRVRGIVQGVGFRPFVYGLAVRGALTGWVRNTSSGVEIVVNGTESQLQTFVEALKNQPPPLARIDSIKTEVIPADRYPDFQILESKADPNDFIPVSPDMTICPDCRRELFDPSDRRYRYPFINCPNCGPLLPSLRTFLRPPPDHHGRIRDVPACSAEYHDPLNRRFMQPPRPALNAGRRSGSRSTAATSGRKTPFSRHGSG